jgi:hypothetical protein
MNKKMTILMETKMHRMKLNRNWFTGTNGTDEGDEMGNQ